MSTTKTEKAWSIAQPIDPLYRAPFYREPPAPLETAESPAWIVHCDAIVPRDKVTEHSPNCLNHQQKDEICRMVSKDPALANLIAAAPRLKEALNRLLTATVDEDLNHGIELTEAEEEARQFALAVLCEATGEVYEAPEIDSEDDLRP